jgi:AcrR family transcriptional regulator
MVLKQRAIATEDKEVRRNALLDSAEALLLEHPDRVASVAEVAEAAGLAKGTVYLYFPSKEEMLLSLHQRHLERYFRELMRLLDGRGRVGFDEVWQVTRDRMIRVPGYLFLTGRCLGLMDRDIPTKAAVAYKVRVAQVLDAAGAALETHFAPLRPGQGVTLLQHSYGLIVGLWQLLHPIERFGSAMKRAELALFRRDYEREVEQALRALWSGSMALPGAPAPKRRSR